jgi:hypothetical protein
LKDNSIMDQELKELLNGKMILTFIQAVLTHKIDSVERVTNILFRQLEITLRNLLRRFLRWRKTWKGNLSLC